MGRLGATAIMLAQGCEHQRRAAIVLLSQVALVSSCCSADARHPAWPQKPRAGLSDHATDSVQRTRSVGRAICEATDLAHVILVGVRSYKYARVSHCHIA